MNDTGFLARCRPILVSERNSVNSMTKWLLVLPAFIAVTIVGWIGLTLVWNLVATINIVPQNDFISLGLANFGINAIASGAGVMAGVRLAPTMQQQTAITLATLTILFALAMLTFGAGFRASTSMSLGWHIWSTLAWVVGGVAAAVQSGKSERR